MATFFLFFFALLAHSTLNSVRTLVHQSWVTGFISNTGSVCDCLRVGFEIQSNQAKSINSKRLEFEMIIVHDGIKYKLIRRGCGASGWRMSPNIYYRCIECGYLMNGDPNKDDACTCGKLHKDNGMGRFGSRLGDSAIEVYRKI